MKSMQATELKLSTKFIYVGRDLIRNGGAVLCRALLNIVDSLIGNVSFNVRKKNPFGFQILKLNLSCRFSFYVTMTRHTDFWLLRTKFYMKKVSIIGLTEKSAV